MTNPSHQNKRSKKAVVLNQNRRRFNPATIVIGFVVLMIVLATAYFVTDSTQTGPQVTASITNSATEVRYPVSRFDDGRAQHFSHSTDGGTIRYFIIKSADGVIRSAFDACDVCWPAGKGYFQDGDDMVCRNCDRRFASIRVNEVKGGCNPAPLNRTVKNGQLIIKTEDILKGQSYFNFKGA